MPLLLIECKGGAGKFGGVFSAGAHGNFHFLGNTLATAGQFIQVLPHDHGAFVIHNMIVIHMVMVVSIAVLRGFRTGGMRTVVGMLLRADIVTAMILAAMIVTAVILGLLISGCCLRLIRTMAAMIVMIMFIAGCFILSDGVGAGRENPSE
jgi:hypothetical protein